MKLNDKRVETSARRAQLRLLTWVQRCAVGSALHATAFRRVCYLQDDQAARAQRLAARAQRGRGRGVVQRMRQRAQRQEGDIRLCSALHAVK